MNLEHQETEKDRIGRLALKLALTLTREEEDKLKEELKEFGLACTATGTGGDLSVIGQKINNAVTGAALNEGIIEKKDIQLHAVIHASLEAKEGMLLKTSNSANIVLKIGIVRNENWIAVAMYGYSAMHSITNHERAGLGLMHL